MNSPLKNNIEITSTSCPFEQDIRSNIAWLGHVSGLKAEKLLRGQTIPYLYVLREGEYEGDYYVTFVRPDLSIAHVPFTINLTDTGWYCENSLIAILSPDSQVKDILHRVMHCEKGEDVPLSLTNQDKKI